LPGAIGGAVVRGLNGRKRRNCELTCKLRSRASCCAAAVVRLVSISRHRHGQERMPPVYPGTGAFAMPEKNTERLPPIDRAAGRKSLR
jgi:hypothetical protein